VGGAMVTQNGAGVVTQAIFCARSSD